MSSISWSGTLTLLLLWIIGPCIYLGIWAVKLIKKNKNNNKENNDDIEIVVDELEEEEKDGDGDGDDDERGQESKDSNNWTSMEYAFTLVGYAIGMSNVWRFCYVVAQNGGSASVFAYIICTIFVGTPLLLYEMILGQYLRSSFAVAWTAIKPRWEGLALSQFVMVAIVQSYFVMIIGYTVPYMFNSCIDPLPWVVHKDGSEGYWYEQVLGLREYSPSTIEDVNGTSTTSIDELVDVDGIEMKWTLVASLLFVWVIIFFASSFGKRILSDVTYVTVLLPVILMVILIIRTTALPGAIDGIEFYVGKFEARKLLEAEVWTTALSQCMFSLGTGLAVPLSLSSMTDKKEDVYRAAIITSIMNSLYAIASGFAIFAMVGNLAYNDDDRDVAEIASSGGFGLAFIIIASAMPAFGSAANAVSVVFFFMLFTLGLDTSFAWSETLLIATQEFIEKYGGVTKDKQPASWKISLTVSVFCFLLGLPYATTKGILILDGADHTIGLCFLLLVCFVESIVLIFDVKFKRLEYMLQHAMHGTSTERSLLRPRWCLCQFDFYVAIPISCIGLFVYNIYTSTQDRILPNNPTIEIICWTLFGCCVALLLFGIWKRGDGVPKVENIPLEEFPYGEEYWANKNKRNNNDNKENIEAESSTSNGNDEYP